MSSSEPKRYSLEELIREFRDTYEEDEGEERSEARMAVAITCQRDTNGYQVKDVLAFATMPDLDLALRACRRFYTSDCNALMLITDAWSHPSHIKDQMQKEEAEFMETKPSREAVAVFGEYMLEKYKRPSHYPMEIRTEVSTYIACGDDGEFLAARQNRGMEHELKWFGGATSPEPDNHPYTGALGYDIRKIVERVE